jgi:hypothetical protein
MIEVLNTAIKNFKKISFNYFGETIETVPYKIKENNLWCFLSNNEGDGFKTYIIDFIEDCKLVEIECEGCLYNCPGQRDHMGYGGCLSEE